MAKKKLLVGLILFGLGCLGIASILTLDIPLPPEIEQMLLEKFSPNQIKLLILVNPTLLLLTATVIGTTLYRQANLSIPIVEKLIGLRGQAIDISSIIIYGVIGGILSGVLLSVLSLAFTPFLSTELDKLGESLELTVVARLLYGGITEEILMRFGLMTLLVFLLSKIIKGAISYIYWIAIIATALIFAIGHFPIVYQTIATPTIELLAYVLIGNTIGGVIFGWLYWKKGLESAFIAHMCTHLVMLLAEHLLY